MGERDTGHLGISERSSGKKEGQNMCQNRRENLLTESPHLHFWLGTLRKNWGEKERKYNSAT